MLASQTSDRSAFVLLRAAQITKLTVSSQYSFLLSSCFLLTAEAQTICITVTILYQRSSQQR